MRLTGILIFFFAYFCNYLQVFAGVSVEFSSLLSDADKLLIAQMQDGGQTIAAEVSEISGRAPKMAYTTFEESEKLRKSLLLHRSSRATKNQMSHFAQGSNKTSTEMAKSAESHYEVGEARTVPLLFMGMFGIVEFFVLSAVALALITPVIGSLLLIIKFMFTAGLIMIG